MTDGPESPPPATASESDITTRRYFSNASGRRVNTACVVLETLHYQYPDLHIVVSPERGSNLLDFAAAGHARAELIDSDAARFPESLKYKTYVPPARRLDDEEGRLAGWVDYGKFAYDWEDNKFIIYLADGRDGMSSYPQVRNYYILTKDKAKADALIVAAGKWSSEVQEEVWVFDQGNWQKSSELFRSIMQSSWDNVILDKEMKNAIIGDHLTFFTSRDSYARLKVPWKRGLLYYGPPGNGKTISIKATMKMLWELEKPVITLYVRSLASYGGPEYSIQSIFQKARQLAPCYLVFEDLDTLISPSVRSYFLNEVDGLRSNDGIFMIGSTNHIDQLDPGISKRPSRFDRKYLFPDPDFKQRVAYCQFWQHKLASNKEIDFPDSLCAAIANITEDFSFAYMQEAFVAALLAIARRAASDAEDDSPAQAKDEDARSTASMGGLTITEDVGDGWVEIVVGDGELDGLVLWVEIKRQIEILRDGMNEEGA